jgi:N-acetylneuraminate epimerase
MTSDEIRDRIRIRIGVRNSLLHMQQSFARRVKDGREGKRSQGLLTLIPLLVAMIATAAGKPGLAPLRWEPLPSIPDREGFAGAFSGVSHGALIVAGGANIPTNKWADDFVKVWHDSVFVLERPDGSWRQAGKLPGPLGYGVSITAGDGLICIGGSDVRQHHADAFRLEWTAGKLITSQLPPLPRPCANFCGALVGNTIYVAGGIETPSATTALKTFLALDLSAKTPRWVELPPWSGPERMLSVAGAMNDSFLLFSGTRLKAGADGKPGSACPTCLAPLSPQHRPHQSWPEGFS